MKSEFNPLKLDVAAFARAQGTLSGEWPMEALPRVRACVPAEVADRALQPVRWSVRGDLRAARGGAHEVWLHLDASVVLPMECQRCLRPVEQSIHVQRAVRFVADEETAAELDADSEDDVLVLSRSFDLRGWIEDELILDMPLVPRHERCPQPLLVAAEAGPPVAPSESPEPPAQGDRPHPFAALAALKKPPEGSSGPN